MFDSVDDSRSVDDLEQELLAAEAAISRLRRHQAHLLARLDHHQVTLADGVRSLAEWTAARLDVEPGTAKSLVEVARSEHVVEAGSFDRVTAMTRLAGTDAGEETFNRAWGFDLPGVRRIVGRHRRLSRRDEHDLFASRFLMIQPSLDEAWWRVTGQLAGLDGKTVETVLSSLADQTPRLPDGTKEARAARMADALVQVCQDHTEDGDPPAAAAGPHATVFVDARDAAPSDGETGVWVASGTRIGPAALEEILCTGTIEVTALTSDGTPIAVGDATTAIPGRLRRHILHRDEGVCSIDGCQSRYRLEPHHIQPRRHDGDNHPDNLTTVCWHHHHVVIHGRGFQLDPDSPAQRRRFLRNNHPPP